MNYVQVHHQFSLFTEVEMRMRFKVPISADRIRQVKTQIASGEYKSAAEALREVNDRLEDFAKKRFGKHWD